MSITDKASAIAARQNKGPRKGRYKIFFKGVWAELKKVHWPSKKQLVNYTGVVLVTVLALSLVISAFDWIVSTLVNLLLSLA